MYDKVENAVLSLSRRERVLLDPLGASEKSDAKNKEPKEGSFYGYKQKNDNYVHGLDD